MTDRINDALSGLSPAQCAAVGAGATAATIGAYSVYSNAGDVKKAFFRVLKAAPGASAIYKSLGDKAAADLREDIHGATCVHDDVPEVDEIPDEGLSHEVILKAAKTLADHEEHLQSSGRISGVVYGGEKEHTTLQNQIYALYSLSNPLHPDIFPSTKKMEAEVIAMTLSMLRGGKDCVGAMTSGGTESILLAMKAYRDWGRAHRGITAPEIVMPVSAHPAFNKAAAYFGIKLVRTKIDPVTYRADLKAMEAAITSNTVALVGSSPQYPHGVVDDITGIAKLAKERGIGCHSDCCLGGYFLAWARQFCDDIPAFDFSVDGVTSISCDTHKYGYSVKGTSTVLFNNADLRRHMYFVETDWPGGIYASATVAGSRAGGLVACTWASLLAMGKNGYMTRAREIHKTAMAIKEGIRDGTAGPHVKLMGESYSSVVGFDAKSKNFDIFMLMDQMKQKHGWVLNPLQMPQGIHVCVTYPIAGQEQEFLDNLRTSAEYVAKHGSSEEKGSAAIYGMTSTLPDREAVADTVTVFLDVCLETRTDGMAKIPSSE